MSKQFKIDITHDFGDLEYWLNIKELEELKQVVDEGITLLAPISKDSEDGYLEKRIDFLKTQKEHLKNALLDVDIEIEYLEGKIETLTEQEEED